MWNLLGWPRLKRPGAFATSLLALSIAAAAASACAQPQPLTIPTPSPGPSTAVPVASPDAEAAVANSLFFQDLPSIADLVEEVSPAVASITTESLRRGLFFEFPNEAAGTGMIVRPDGYLVTNLHVVDGATDIRVHLSDGRTFQAEIVGRDFVSDLAVLKIDARGLPTIRFGSSDGLRVGDWVIAVGNAAGLKGGPSVTLGIISARGRTITTDRGQLYDLIQTDAAINDGNSGGPLINLRGEVVGINTAILRQAQGIGFAVSASVAEPIIESLIESGRFVRPLIGLMGDDLTQAMASELNLSTSEGIVVTRMTRDGPAFLAGIRVGDVITELDGLPTPDMARFLSVLWSHGVGDTIEVRYFNDDAFEVTTLTLQERPR